MNRYRLCIKGKNPDYFLNKLIDRKINIYELERNSRELYKFKMNIKFLYKENNNE